MAQNNEVTPKTPITDEAMMRLVKIMNDSPTIIRFAGTEWEIKPLRAGTQWLIAEEACKIVDKENMTMGDVIKQFAENLPSVARVITLALLNDKDKIYGEEYNRVYETIMWGDVSLHESAILLSEILQLIDISFFFACTDVVKTLRRTTLDRKITTEEQ